MRLLVVADLHYALPQFDWVLQAAPRYDLVILAGDLLDTNSSVDPGAQIIVVLNYLKRLRQVAEVVVCSGNHDLDALDDGGEKHARWMRSARRLAVLADGDTAELGDTLVTVCPWWDGPLARDAIALQLGEAALRRRGRWIWVHHAPPMHSPVSWAGGRHFGDETLNGWIATYSPDYVFSGHVHEAPFARGGSWVDRIGSTWLFNTGRQIGPVPTTVCIDTERREAAWLSQDGAELVPLDEPLIRPVPPLTRLPEWVLSR